MSENVTILGRRCGSCTLCCKVLSIGELEKPQGKWCDHCAIGEGCRIYESRPTECVGFHCGYLSWEVAGDHWFPATSKMVIVSELDGARIGVHVDPGRPGVWRDKPYYDDLKRWAYVAAQNDMQVVVCIGNRAIVILPREDVDLGPVAPNERIVTRVVTERATGRTTYEAVKLRADDPRIAKMASGKVRRTPRSEYSTWIEHEHQFGAERCHASMSI